MRQETIEGHAVRATLLCAGLAAAGTVNDRADYLDAARRLWNNMVERRMYVIGGLGAVAGHEGFGPDYDLPNNGYLETCAAVGAGFFHHNMNLAFADARYADELERVLYNGILSGVSLKGDSYFYENPLEAGKNRTRWAWHGCPCCPPMFLKIMGALPGYIYAQDQDGVYVGLFIGSKANLTVNGTRVVVGQTTRYPWDGAVRLSVEPVQEREFTVNVRLPGWCAEPKLKVNGEPVTSVKTVHGYARLKRTWRRGDVVELTLPMPVERIKAHPKVVADIGRVALQRGPIVYCLEGVDNGGQVRSLVIPRDARLGATSPRASGWRDRDKGAGAGSPSSRLARYALPADRPRAWRHRMRVHGHPLLCQCQPRALRDGGLDGRGCGPCVCRYHKIAEVRGARTDVVADRYRVRIAA